MKYCRRHPGVEVTPYDMGDNFCLECFMRAWNAGARYADAHWADNPQQPYADEQSPDGRNILQEMQGHYKRAPGEQ